MDVETYLSIYDYSYPYPRLILPLPPQDSAGVLMPPPGMYPPPQGVLGQPRLGPPMPGAGYQPGLLMPPASQPLYMHHHQQQHQPQVTARRDGDVWW